MPKKLRLVRASSMKIDCTASQLASFFCNSMRQLDTPHVPRPFKSAVNR